MNKLTKMAIVAAGVALAVQAAFAAPNDNDLILSINNNDNGGSTEFTVNLGSETSFTSPNYDLSSLLSSFNSSYASAGASGLNVGVAGGQTGQGGLSDVGNDVFTTTLRTTSNPYTIPGSSAPGVTPSKANIGSAGGVAGGFGGYGSNLATSDPDNISFTAQIATDPTTAGTAANNFTGDLGTAADPLSTMTGSTISLDLWKDTVTTSSTTSGWVYQGDLTLDLSGSNPSLVWDTSPVPEPSTYSLFAAAGVLVFSLRRFRHKHA